MAGLRRCHIKAVLLLKYSRIGLNTMSCQLAIMLLPPRPRFDLGKWGYKINVVSLLWSVIVVLFFVFSRYVPVAGPIANMNCAIAKLAGVVVFGGIYLVCKGGGCILLGVIL